MLEIPPRLRDRYFRTPPLSAGEALALLDGSRVGNSRLTGNAKRPASSSSKTFPEPVYTRPRVRHSRVRQAAATCSPRKKKFAPNSSPWIARRPPSVSLVCSMEDSQNALRVLRNPDTSFDAVGSNSHSTLCIIAACRPEPASTSLELSLVSTFLLREGVNLRTTGGGSLYRRRPRTRSRYYLWSRAICQRQEIIGTPITQ